MAGSSVLREFVVKLGFKQEEQQYRNFRNNLQNISKSALEISKAFVKTGAAVTAAMSGVGLALHSVAKGMEGVYYSSQRTGASAKELGALEYAFQRVGLSAEDARGSVESLAAARRSNPGLNGLLASMGITDTDNAKALVQLLGKLRDMPAYMRNMRAAQFGLSGEMVTQVENNGPEFLDGLQRREAMYRKEGYNPDEAAKKARDFINQWDDAKAHFTDISQELAVKLLPLADHVLTFLGEVADGFAAADKATDGWSTTIVALVVALTPLLGTLKFLGAFKAIGAIGKGIGGLLGRGTATASAEGAGEASGGLLSGGAIVTGGLVAALIGLLTVVFSKTAADWVRQKLGLPEKITGDMVKGFATSILGKSGASSAFKGLAELTSHFEGYRAKVYKDIAGHETIFYGHLVRAGESIQALMKEGPASVLARDLKAASASVAKLVKVHLSDNQAKALSDFVFNLGGGKLAHSTLLKKLNSGDYAGAADQFQYWNKALVNGHLQAVQGLTNRRAADAQLFRTPDRAVSISQKTDYHISSTDPHGAASEVERRQNRVNADLVRNMAGAYQ